MTLVTLFMMGIGVASSWAQAASDIMIHPQGSAVVQAGTIHYEFELMDMKTGKELGDSDLKIAHEKKLHFLIYDSSLNEFRHVHPEYDGDVWSVDFDLPRNGNYRLWAQGKIAKGAVEFSVNTEMSVENGIEAWPSTPVLPDLRSGEDSNSIVSLSGGSLKSGAMVNLDLEFTRADGTTPELTDYLGAFAHVVAVPEGGDELLHVHPMSTGKSSGMIHATFPKPGGYRIWVQFIDGGTLKTIPLSVVVN